MAKAKQSKPSDSEVFHELVTKQREFFKSGVTKPVKWRIKQLNKLFSTIKTHESDILQALNADLGKTEFEAYSTEIGLVYSEIRYQKKHVKKWAKIKKVHGELFFFPAKPKIYPEPFGCTLIMSPWNYPFLLTIEPLVSAIAAGNTAVLKTSEYSPATAQVIDNIIKEAFFPEFITTVQGGYIQNQLLLHEHFDFIFFTGSTAVGKIVMESAAKFLTPVCLELGGKSPCIVDKTANIEVAARRIVWGKFLNAGQTCVAPDYILVDETVKDKLVQAINQEILNQYGDDPLSNPDLPKIINTTHFGRLVSLAPDAQTNSSANKIAPTIMDLGAINGEAVSNHPVMKQEIFGPLLPIITFNNLDEVIDFVYQRPTPLALYFFSKNKKAQKTIFKTLRFGGGCINDVIYQLVSNKLPFGGCGESGMGSYHGKFGFDTFTHYKGVIKQSSWMDLKYRYAPHGDNIAAVKKFLK